MRSNISLNINLRFISKKYLFLGCYIFIYLGFILLHITNAFIIIIINYTKINYAILYVFWLIHNCIIN